ncbi:unnamed protein product [Protopolystoma xenopodis]|uniref:Uncharacterized protein n=1 Tax=Protopolystoma xenopodis TaxID=117903 RepID=A0A448XRN1_9PLAT|nr:unnamed protein product [Protopolystoma xenopodis]
MFEITKVSHLKEVVEIPDIGFFVVTKVYQLDETASAHLYHKTGAETARLKSHVGEEEMHFLRQDNLFLNCLLNSSSIKREPNRWAIHFRNSQLVIATTLAFNTNKREGRPELPGPTGQDRTGQDRTGQDRTEEERREERTISTNRKQ